MAIPTPAPASPGAGLRDRVCVVTGGTRGIGAAIARGLAGAGARVVVFGRDPERLDRFAERTRAEYGAAVLALAVDVADDGGVERAFARVVDTWGTVHALVNNAGVTKVGASLDYDLADWRRILDVNVTGLFACCQQAARVMAGAGGGSIVNIASIASFVGQPERAAYVASKSAVLGVTKALAVEWGPLGIRVNAIAPGYIETDIVADLFRRGVLRRDLIESRTPLRRLGAPEDLVAGALYLLSEQASFATGQVLTLDGGWLANGYIR
ncbi:SDR family NAD(P)-dependent oxidoreductase [Georgenia sp. AZ-5]|uniref:SDR family NAD(P)-dependent oxidoreductase n=1 Tax=Georgenia sp. AZ-5 TaxID=3367526 RepID=UPI00375405F4